MLHSTAGLSVVWYEWVDVVKHKREKLESKFVEPKGTLDNQPYNTKQLVDNMNKNKVLKQILIKEKVDTKAEIAAFSMQYCVEQSERFTPHGSENDFVASAG